MNKSSLLHAPARPATLLRLHPVEWALLLVAVIWGGSYSAAKIATEQLPVLQFRAVGVSFEGRQALIPHLQRGEWGRLGRLGRWAKVARGGAGTGVSAYPPMSRCLRVALPSPANPRCPG